MVSERKGCQRDRLRHLLRGDPSEDWADLLSHLEECVSCRAELERLAADPKWWDVARRYLDSGRVASLEDREDSRGAERSSDGVTKGLTSADEVVISRLKESSHPELLGYLDSYEVLEIVGRGGMGIVFKAFERRLNRYVAIKILAPHWASNATSRQRFAREAQAAAAVIHPNVVPIHAVGSLGDLPYLVMSFVSGQSLQTRIDRCGVMATKDVLRVGMQMAAGLAAAHAQGLVHRDVKPGNVLLENNVERVLLTDFGLARAVDDAELTLSGSISGTPYYMSPEQARGESIDYGSDLFSLGSVLYAMCTGHSPFRAQTTVGALHRICYSSHRDVREIEEDVSDDLAGIINKLLAKDPAERFQSAGEVVDAIGGVLTSRQERVRVDIDRSADVSLSAQERDDSKGGLQGASGGPSQAGGLLRRWSIRCLLAVGMVGAVAAVLIMYDGLQSPARPDAGAVARGSAGSDVSVAPSQVPVAGSDVLDEYAPDALLEKFDFSFRESRFDSKVFVLTGVNSPYAVSLIVPEQEGLRITIPAGQAANKPRLGFSPALELHGDFDVIAGYEILAAEPGAAETKSGATIELVSADGLASAWLRRCCCLGKEAVYLVGWREGVDMSDGDCFEVRCATKGSFGRLRIARRGDFLAFLAAEGAGNESREIHRIEFGREPVGAVQFAAVAEDGRGRVDIRWCDVELRAAELCEVDFPLRFDP